MYLLVLSRLSFSSYFVSLTSVFKEDDKNVSLNSSSLRQKVMSFSLSCALTLISSFSVSNLSKLDIIKCHNF